MLTAFSQYHENKPIVPAYFWHANQCELISEYSFTNTADMKTRYDRLVDSKRILACDKQNIRG